MAAGRDLMNVLLIPAPDPSQSVASGVGRYLATLVRDPPPDVVYHAYTDRISFQEESAGESAAGRMASAAAAPSSPSSLRLALGYVRDTLRLMRAIRPFRSQVDIVHVNRVGCEIQTIAARLAGFRRIVATVHNLPGEDPAAGHWFRRRIEHLSFASADRLIVVSEAAYESWRDRIGLTRQRVVTIYNGLDGSRPDPQQAARFRQSLGVAPATVVFGICARLHSMKGHAVLIDAFARLPASLPVELWIAGSGPEEHAIRAAIRHYGLESRVRMLGYLPAPSDFMAAQDVNMLPSVTLESIGYAVIEAMFSGVPSIVSDVGGAKEIIGASGGGQVVARRDVAALAQAMTDYAADAGRRRREGDQARLYAEAHLTGQAMREATWRVYRDMVP